MRALEAPTGKGGWPVVIRNPVDESVLARIEMANEILSSSGMQAGGHGCTHARVALIGLKVSAALASRVHAAMVRRARGKSSRPSL